MLNHHPGAEQEDKLKIAKVRHKWPAPQPIRSEGCFHHSPLFSETLAFGSPLRSPYDWRGGKRGGKFFSSGLT